MNPKVEVTTQVMYNFKISSKHILLSKNYCPIIQYISQYVKCCLVKNHMKYRKHVWNPRNELIIAILEHLMHGIWITSATGHLSAALSQAHRHSTLHSSKFNSTKMRLTGTMQVERTASDAPLVHDAYPWSPNLLKKKDFAQHKVLAYSRLPPSLPSLFAFTHSIRAPFSGDKMCLCFGRQWQGTARGDALFIKCLQNNYRTTEDRLAVYFVISRQSNNKKACLIS